MESPANERNSYEVASSPAHMWLRYPQRSHLVRLEPIKINCDLAWLVMTLAGFISLPRFSSWLDTDCGCVKTIFIKKKIINCHWKKCLSEYSWNVMFFWKLLITHPRWCFEPTLYPYLEITTPSCSPATAPDMFFFHNAYIYIFWVWFIFEISLFCVVFLFHFSLLGVRSGVCWSSKRFFVGRYLCFVKHERFGANFGLERSHFFRSSKDQNFF